MDAEHAPPGLYPETLDCGSDAGSSDWKRRKMRNQQGDIKASRDGLGEQ